MWDSGWISKFRCRAPDNLNLVLMKIFFLSLLIAVAAYLVAAVGGYFLINKLSSNTHDKSMEATMTAAFVLGPIAAIIAFIAAYFYLRSH